MPQLTYSRALFAGEQASSSYCVRKGLIRKAHLAHNLKKWAAKHPAGVLAASVPESFVLEVYDVEYIDEALCDLPEVRLKPEHVAFNTQRHGMTYYDLL